VNARYLLISDPPHGDTAAADVASRFGLTAAEVQMKANYGVPEIWFAEDEEAKLLDTAEALDAAGLRTVLVSGSDLGEIPRQSPAESFSFTDEGLQGVSDDTEWTLDYDAPTTAVFSRPRVDVQEAKAPAISTPSLRRDPLLVMGRGGVPRRSPVELGASPFLDLYALSDDGLVRISIAQEITSASLPHGLSAMQNLVSECESRFENAYFDHRLVDMTLRGTANVVTEVTFETHRSRFSYATEALSHLLGSLSPDLKDTSQADLSSRLAYLTNRSRIS
jgi:hypothetical protein